MADKNLKPTVIEEIPFPVGGQKSSDVSGNSNSPTQIGDKSFPSPTIANNVVSASLNTISRRIISNFSFARYGAISVGNYDTGAGVRISPNGIVGGVAGVPNFALDALTGNVSIRGTITALAGSIGGFTIATGYLYAGSGANTAGIAPADYPFWAGATYANRATAPFRVTPAGAMVALSGVIGGFTIGTTTLFSPAVSPTIILDSAGSITVANGDDKVLLNSSSGVGWVDFYVGGTRRGGLKGSTSGLKAGIGTDGDFALTVNDKSFLMLGTSAGDYASLGVDGSNQVLLKCTSSNEFFVKSTNSDTSYFHTTNSHVYINTRDNGNLYITTGTGKMTMGSNLDMNEKNIDGCDTVWAKHFEIRP